MALTVGGLGLWYLYDLILVASGSFRDVEGRLVRRWDPEEAVPTRRSPPKSSMSSTCSGARWPSSPSGWTSPNACWRARGRRRRRPAHLSLLTMALSSLAGRILPRPAELRPMLRLAIPGGRRPGRDDAHGRGGYRHGRPPHPRGSSIGLAAVALGHLYFFGIGVFGMGTLMVLDPVVAQAVGAKDEIAVARGMQRGVLLAVLLAVPSLASSLWPAPCSASPTSPPRSCRSPPRTSCASPLACSRSFSSSSSGRACRRSGGRRRSWARSSSPTW